MECLGMSTKNHQKSLLDLIKPKGAQWMAALSAGQVAVVAHVAAHELGAAAYAIRAVMESVTKPKREAARLAERDWQRSRLPEQIRELVLDDQRLRNNICWFVFGDKGGE
jgi:uncharacterized protein YcaQ